MSVVSLIAGIAWDPQIRGVLGVLVGVVVLMGSIYMLLGTNLGHRLGFLVALSTVFGFLAMLCLIWWIYAPANGPRGRSPSWQVIETNIDDLGLADLERARPLDTSGLPDPEEIKDATPAEFADIAAEHEPELHGWKLLEPSDPSLGEASAAVDAFLAGEDVDEASGFEETSDYILRYAFEEGGKPDLPEDPNRWDRIRHYVTNSLRVSHPTHYALIQVQQTIEHETVAGAAPPTPEPDPDGIVVSVILTRDIGEARLPAGLAATGFSLLFALTCWMLHRRDQRVTELRALPVGG